MRRLYTGDVMLRGATREELVVTFFALGFMFGVAASVATLIIFRLLGLI